MKKVIKSIVWNLPSEISFLLGILKFIPKDNASFKSWLKISLHISFLFVLTNK